MISPGSVKNQIWRHNNASDISAKIGTRRTAEWKGRQICKAPIDIIRNRLRYLRTLLTEIGKYLHQVIVSLVGDNDLHCGA